MANFTGSLVTLGLLLLGLVLMATPLALWVAWTDTLLLVVLAAGVTASVLYCVLVRFERPAVPGQSDSADSARIAQLPGKLIEELQALHPFVHHHRPSGGPKFRAAMNRLKRLLY